MGGLEVGQQRALGDGDGIVIGRGCAGEGVNGEGQGKLTIIRRPEDALIIDDRVGDVRVRLIGMRARRRPQLEHTGDAIIRVKRRDELAATYGIDINLPRLIAIIAGSVGGAEAVIAQDGDRRAIGRDGHILNAGEVALRGQGGNRSRCERVGRRGPNKRDVAEAGKHDDAQRHDERGNPRAAPARYWRGWRG